MKKWKRILAVAVMLALVFCAGRGSAVLVKSWQNGGLLGVNAVASTTENWGLGFGESGTQPTGNATPEELRKYNTYFIGNGDDKVIYLTFDCGYENGNTEKILEALKKHDVKATFFVVGHGSLVRVDINTDEYEAEQYSLDDVIDIVCEWNDELIRYTSQELNELSQGQDKSSLEVKLASLKQDEIRLDKMFEQTKYPAEIEALAVQLADAFIERLGLVGIDQSVKELTDSIRSEPVKGGAR